MSEEAPKAVEVEGARADLQDPLPENNWKWRRIFSFAAVAISFILFAALAYAVHRIVNVVIAKVDEIDGSALAGIAIMALRVIGDMAYLMFWLTLAGMTYYLIAPSAEHLVKVVQSASLLKNNIPIRRIAEVETDAGIARSETIAGRGPGPSRPMPQGGPLPPRRGDDDDVAPRSRR